MTKWLAMLTACAALGLVAVGCGDDEDDGGGGGAAETTEQTEEPSGDTGGGGGAQAPEISMENIAFTPTELVVKKGTKVTWTNNESVGHDVEKTGGPGPEFSSGEPGGMGEGDTFEHTFKAAGTYDYVCTVHPNMSGFVIVE